MPNTLSIVLITLNEAANLPRTLASVRGLGEIIVLDSGSTDATVDIARSFGARIFTEPWKGFGAQKNSAISHATTDWILSLDADEELSPALVAEIQSLLAGNPAFNAYFIPRLNHFLARRRCVTAATGIPIPSCASSAAAPPPSVTVPFTKTMQSSEPVGRLRGHLIHHCYPTLDEYIEHMNRYSTIYAQMLFEYGRAASSSIWLFWNALVNPAATFFYNYVFRLGFLDGRAGLLQHINHSVYIHWKFAKASRLALVRRNPPR